MPSSYSSIEMGNLRFPWLSCDSNTEKEQERLLFIQRYVLSANLGPSPGLCLMEFAREVVEDLVSNCKLLI